MARRVFLHVGGAKTGTTYLQNTMWRNRDLLTASGVLVPGKQQSDHVRAAAILRGKAAQVEDDIHAWPRITRQVREFGGDAIISHEFFGPASPAQARRVLADLAPAEVHLVYTARDLTRVVPTLWQEQVKFTYPGDLDSYDPAPLSSRPQSNWSWRVIDAADALDRWGRDLPPAQVHVVTVPRDRGPRNELWRRFAQACDLDPLIEIDPPDGANVSLGLVETELLRRVTPHLDPVFGQAGERPRWVRTYLAHRVLASVGGSRPIVLPPERYREVRARGVRIAEQIQERGYDVVGDLGDLIAPEEPPLGSSSAEVTDEELLRVASLSMAQMLSDYRAAQRRVAELEARERRAADLFGRARRRSRQALSRALRSD